MGRKIIITAGGTVEPIDGVRSIANNSTGRLGYTICTELLNTKLNEIDKIYYICSEKSIVPNNHPKVEIINITDTNSVKEQVEYLLKNYKIDYFIHSMAVSDYSVESVTNAKMLAENILKNINIDLGSAEQANKLESLIKYNTNIIDLNTKVSSYEDNLIITLKQTPKIISMIKNLSESTYLVGFKLLNNVTEEELYNIGYKLLQKNRCNLVVANDLKNISNEKHEAIIIDEQGNKAYANTKQDIAEKLIKVIWEE